MGTFFEKTYICRKNAFIFDSWIAKAAKDIGYTMSPEGRGVPVRILIYNDNAEWFGLDSPLLETPETAEVFLRALSREFKAPALNICCVDSDFAVCRLIDGAGGESVACINEPYEDMGFGEAEPAVWAAACKKKWKCRERQFEEVFSGEYVSAEDGLMKLAGLIHIPVESFEPDGADDERVYVREFRIMPETEFEADPMPRTLEERLAAYMDETFAQKLTDLGFKRFGGSSLRWHKVFGEEGRELISSIVLVVRYGHEIVLFYGSQPVCCPLALSDKFFPMHDWNTFWNEAKYEFPRRMGWDPQWDDNRFIPVCEPEMVFPYINDFVIGILEKVTDITSCRRFAKHNAEYELVYQKYGMFSYSFAYKMLVEALLADDQKDASSWSKKLLKEAVPMDEYFPNNQKGIEKQMLRELPALYAEKGACACLDALKKVRDANMKKLEKGGVI